jgi:hypothetical protein
MKQFLLLITIVFTASCGTITLVPDHDSALETQITEAAKANDKIYLQLLNSEPEKRAFADFEKEYMNVEVEIHSIQLRNEVRKNNKEMLDIISRLNKVFSKIRNEHKAMTRPIKDAEIIDFENEMTALWKALLRAEKGLPKEATQP